MSHHNNEHQAESEGCHDDFEVTSQLKYEDWKKFKYPVCWQMKVKSCQLVKDKGWISKTGVLLCISLKCKKKE